MKLTLPFLVLLFLFLGCKSLQNKSSHDAKSGATKIVNKVHYDKEKHLKNVKQLTFGGDNAEAYWSFDNKNLVFQATNKDWGLSCDQIFTMGINDDLSKGQIPQLVSTGTGRTTCSYFLPGNETIIYSSTHLADLDCPPVPKKEDYRNKYIWPVYKGYDIFITDTKGNQLKQLTFEDGYDAEPTVSPKGDKIVFTSTRTGDLELFTMNIDGSDVKQITSELGYDGGAFFSPEGTKLIFRSSRPKTEKAINEYKKLLSQGLVQPTNMELYICNVDGSEISKITNLGSANWAPFFHPSGKKVIFSSNRNNNETNDTNLFIADWVN